MKEKWFKIKDKEITVYVKGKEGLKFYKDIKKQSKIVYKLFKPSADFDDKYDMIYIAFNGGRGVEYSVESKTKQGNTVIFDFDIKDNVVGVEIEGLTSKYFSSLEKENAKLKEKLKSYKSYTKRNQEKK
jgi:hypothetical protein